MTILSDGQRTSVSVGIGQALNINAAAGAVVIVRQANPQGGEPYAPVTVDATTQVFGPYDSVALFKVSATRGTVTSNVTGNYSSDRVYAKTVHSNRQTTIYVPIGSTLAISGTGDASLVAVGSSTPIAYAGTPVTIGPFTDLRTYVVRVGYGPVTLTTAFYTGAASVTLGTLALSGTLTNGSASSGTITGATTGSTITSNMTGLSVISGARTYTFDGTATAATISNGLVETLAGATGSPKDSSVTVAAAVAAGAAATTMPITPSTQWHPNTSALTMRSDGTFQGYISGTTLTVTTWASSSCRPLVGMMVLKTGAAAGTTIYRGITSGSTGGLGTYQVSQSQTVGSSGSPATFTVQGDQVTAITDLRGLADLSSSTGTDAPLLMTDALGVKFLRFFAISTATAWLRNNSVTGIDSHNQTWLMVGRVHDIWNSNPKGIVWPGTTENANLSSFNGMGYAYGMVSTRSRNLPFIKAGTSNLNKMFVGEQLQVIGVSSVADNGYGTATNANITAMHVLNEQTVIDTITTGSRQNNTTGMTVNGTGQGYFDLYELVGYIRGEIGTSAQQAARIAAATSALMTNWGIPAIAKSLNLFGDSRTAYGNASNTLNANDGTQTNLGSIIGERGWSWSLPANVRVTQSSFGGEGIGFMGLVIDETPVAATRSPHPCATDFLLGGGADYFSLFMGSNDYGNKWPNTGNGGTAAANTSAIADDMWNGSGYTATATATAAVSATSVTLSGISGTIGDGSRITTAGWNAGFAAAPASATPATLATFYTNLTAHTSESIATTLTTYKQTIVKLLARGLKGMWFTETVSANSAGAADGRLATIILSEAVAGVDAGIGGVYQNKFVVGDLRTPTIGGVQPLNFSGWVNGGQYMADQIHYTMYGRRLVVSGGDTPANGYAERAKTLLAL